MDNKQDNKQDKKRRAERPASPEQIDDYIRVTTPGMWILVSAMLALLLAGLIWAYAGRIEKRDKQPDGQVTTEYIAPASFLTDAR
jgi:hypothetical protein